MITLNALRGVSARVLQTKTGSWIADVDVDLEIVPVVPTGPCVLTIGTNILNGTIDDRATGRFGTKAKVRVVGGEGWDKPIPAQHIHNDAGVLSTAVYGVIAAAAKEPPVVEIGPPKLLGTDYVFTRGAASKVFAGVAWWVDILGITHVGPRPALPAPPTADILSWDPKTQVAEIASDILIVPGMTLLDPIRFGTAIVDDVEHTFEEGSARAIAWCSTPSVGAAAASLLGSPPATGGSKVMQGLGQFARQACGVSTLKRYPYRVVVQGPDGRLNLQSTTIGGEAPLFLALIDVWAGIPGLSVKLAPSSIVLVSFIDNGDPAKQQPIIVGFDPDAPPPISLDVTAATHVTFTTPALKAGPLGGSKPVALAGSSIDASSALQIQINALQTELVAMAAAMTALAAVPVILAVSPAEAACLAAASAVGVGGGVVTSEAAAVTAAQTASVSTSIFGD